MFFSYNLGADWDGELPQAIGLYSANFMVGIGKKLKLYAEAFGSKPEKEDDMHQVDLGLLFLLANNFQIDVSGGFGLVTLAPDNYVNVGLSWRLPR